MRRVWERLENEFELGLKWMKKLVGFELSLKE